MPSSKFAKSLPGYETREEKRVEAKVTALLRTWDYPVGRERAVAELQALGDAGVRELIGCVRSDSPEINVIHRNAHSHPPPGSLGSPIGG